MARLQASPHHPKQKVCAQYHRSSAGDALPKLVLRNTYLTPSYYIYQIRARLTRNIQNPPQTKPELFGINARPKQLLAKQPPITWEPRTNRQVTAPIFKPPNPPRPNRCEKEKH